MTEESLIDKKANMIAELPIPDLLENVPELTKINDPFDPVITEKAIEYLKAGYNMKQTARLLGLPAYKIGRVMRDILREMEYSENSSEKIMWALKIQQAATIGELTIEHELRYGSPKFRNVKGLQFLLERKCPEIYAEKFMTEEDSSELKEMNIKDLRAMLQPLLEANPQLVSGVIRDAKNGEFLHIINRAIDARSDNGGKPETESVEDSGFSTAKVAK